MIKVDGARTYSFDIVKTQDIFSDNNDALLVGGDAHPGSKRFLVVDHNVLRLYGEKIDRYFKKRGFLTRVVSVESGDINKSPENFMSIFDELCRFDLRRRSEPIIAIGGGVVTDISGFVASTYRRGVPHIKVPTTLMGYVDASVGIKTGINFSSFKNRMGSFEVPAGVILDKEFLSTLDLRNLINGLGEIIKLAVILDGDIFSELERNGKDILARKFQDKLGEHVLDRSVISMVNELSSNIYEDDLMRRVDFGHTFSLAIESASEYEVMHGEAVAIDVLFSSYIGVRRGALAPQEFERIVVLYKNLGLPMWSPEVSQELFMSSLSERILHRDGHQNLPIPSSIGSCLFINDLTADEICDAVASFERMFQ